MWTYSKLYCILQYRHVALNPELKIVLPPTCLTIPSDQIWFPNCFEDEEQKQHPSSILSQPQYQLATPSILHTLMLGA